MRVVILKILSKVSHTLEQSCDMVQISLMIA